MCLSSLQSSGNGHDYHAQFREQDYVFDMPLKAFTNDWDGTTGLLRDHELENDCAT